jgi:hypothetical protein
MTRGMSLNGLTRRLVELLRSSITVIFGEPIYKRVAPTELSLFDINAMGSTP